MVPAIQMILHYIIGSARSIADEIRVEHSLVTPNDTEPVSEIGEKFRRGIRGRGTQSGQRDTGASCFSGSTAEPGAGRSSLTAAPVSGAGSRGFAVKENVRRECGLLAVGIHKAEENTR
jgi:hypothetical protein